MRAIRNSVLICVVFHWLLGGAASTVSRGKMLAIGDSITAAHIWQQRTGELLGMDVRSHCKGGIGAVGMVDGDGVAPPEYDPDDFGVKRLYDLSVRDVADVDLVLMMGFYNEVGMIVDAGKRGTAMDMYPRENTFCGRLNYAVRRVRETLAAAKNDKARIVLVSPHRYGTNCWVDRTSYETCDHWLSALKGVARHNGIVLVDLLNRGGIGRENWNLYQRSPTPFDARYLTADGSPNVGTNCPFASLADAPDPRMNKGRLMTIRGERGHYSSDGMTWKKESAPYPWFADQLHMNSGGYQLIGEAIAREVKNLNVLQEDIVIDSARLRLVVGADACVKSLVLKPSGEECVDAGSHTPLFSVTQERPFNNEIKLIHPNKRTTYPANALRRENDRLIIGFEAAPYEAVVDLKVTDSYVEFKLADFLVDKEDYDYLKMDVPPVASFRVLQLPVVNRANFGDWLNASWDGTAAIGVVGTSPYPDIDHENRCGYRILSADLVRGQKLKGSSAALVVARGREDFLDCMDRLERDFELPLGVESRRSDAINAFIYHVFGDACPSNIDKHIEWAKRGGFKYMTFNTMNFNKDVGSWGLHGDYDWNEHFPNGAEDLERMLAKVKAAGIHPGLHFLHTHIGLKSRYVTPIADPRLNKKCRFTLARPLSPTTNVTEITVLESTEGAPVFGPCRVLQFGGELVSYESYTTEPPYRFLGVRRGVWETTVISHPRGEIGGVLDISEYGSPMSCYIDQNTDLQDEVAAKIAAVYNCGFEYAYFDGSEGVNAPCNFHVSNAQYRMWKLFGQKPLFSEGAAKTHFDWHILSGANAFDCFRPEIFKENIVRFPVAQAPVSWQDMTRVNFGWWAYFPPGKRLGSDLVTAGTKPEQWQFACSQCLAWDCPATVIVKPEDAEVDRSNAEACFEVMRRWEEVRSRNLLTTEQKLMLRDVSREFWLDENLMLVERRK